jgi:peptidoglycan/xylan/chitin deacetylase (PgdA/CDA1 family)
MTLYIAAYDTETAACLAAVRKIVKVHERFEIPGTFFIVAQLLDAQQAEYVALLKGHPLFEIASHSYTHMVLRDTPEFGQAGPVEQFPHEIVDSKKRIEDAFGCRALGFRAPVSFVDGLKTAPEILRLVSEAGYGYVSSLAWGPSWSLPALLVAPFTYAEQGYPKLWEFPPCGWHENLLKGNNQCGPVRILLFPPYMPQTIPDHYVRTPEEEFAVNNQPFIDKAVADGLPHVSLIWHPWSLDLFDPEMRMVEMTFRYVQDHGIRAGTFADLLGHMTRKQLLASRKK